MGSRQSTMQDDNTAAMELPHHWRVVANPCKRKDCTQEQFDEYQRYVASLAELSSAQADNFKSEKGYSVRRVPTEYTAGRSDDAKNDDDDAEEDDDDDDNQKSEKKRKKSLKICVISDTHTMHNKFSASNLPPADVLVVCGDFANRCKDESHIVDFNEWLGTLKQFRHKVVIAGNQEYIFNDMTREEIQKQLLPNCIYLEDSGCTIDGVKFWGSPWQTSRGMAFSCKRHKLFQKWALIPEDTDVLVTHMPPFNILDLTYNSKHWGCVDLREHVLKRVKPRYHLFGHVHDSPGFGRMKGYPDTVFMNAASKYMGFMLRNPILFDY
eukprot:TRINITY_DN66820_c9_g3_i1.p1 TRINITY_DN66820_c9_g3~~TRINITY_DN66820_c9_g3_i1.p1  ORF type:complete len:324 (-),score=153.84 TRINITY_DN66820_c9_g3_i1:36-1007(-)